MKAALSHWSVAGLAAIASAALVGCGSTPEEPEPARPPIVVHESPPDVSGDPVVEGHLATVIVASRTVGGRRDVQAELHNTSGREIDAAWSIVWYDRDGRVLAAALREWHPVRLAPGAVEPIAFRAPTRDADSWRLVAADPATLSNNEPAMNSEVQGDT